MTRYYWYITISPRNYNSSLSGDGSDIKRSTTRPANDFYYITENINGYQHDIKDKNNLNASRIDDRGEPVEIASIDKTIKRRLMEQWNTDNKLYLEEVVTKNNAISGTPIESSDEDDDYGRTFAMMSRGMRPRGIMYRGMTSRGMMVRKKASSTKKVKRDNKKCKCTPRKIRKK